MNNMTNKNVFSEPAAKSDFLLLIRGSDWGGGLSPEQIQQVVGRLTAWFAGLNQKQVLKGGQPLGSEGKTITGRSRMVADGPFAESKEAVAGYVIIQAASLEEAL